MVGPNQQTNKHTHTHAQCSHASVGLAQARPNKLLPLFIVLPFFLGVVQSSICYFEDSCSRAQKTGTIYSRKYWWSLNLAVWPQAECKKYWQNLNLAVAPCSILSHHQHCTRINQGALPSSRLRHLN